MILLLRLACGVKERSILHREVDLVAAPANTAPKSLRQQGRLGALLLALCYY